jgi:competence protein ComEC
MAGWLAAIALSADAGFAWAAWRAQQRLAFTLPAQFEGRDLRLDGYVAGLPVRTHDGLRFVFELARSIAPADRFPRRFLLHLPARTGVTRVQPGESWRFRVRLRRVHRTVNFHAPNVEASLLERDIRATGTVRGRPEPLRLAAYEFAGISGREDNRPPVARRVAIGIDALRFAVRERIEAALPGAPHLGIVVALAIGDQSLIADADRRHFTRTGTGHLISVSGLHVSLVAGALASLVSLAWRRMPGLAGRAPLWWATPRVSAMAGALAALAYAGLAGFGVPALRAFTMLVAAAAAMVMGRQLAVSTVLAWALGIVVFVDPWAVLSAGFWLSFGAVSAILFATSGRIDVRARDALSATRPAGRSPAYSAWRVAWSSTWGSALHSAWRTQWAVTIALVPLTLFWFAQIPLVGPLANALAIPWASLVTTPLTLVAIILPAPLDAWTWHLAHATLTVLMRTMGWFGAPAWAVLPLRAPDLPMLLLATAGALWWLMPPGWPLRAMAWLLWLPLLVPGERPEAGEFRLTAFDVGQGGAVLIETHAHRLLFDTGPRYGGGSDAGRAILLPALAAAGVGRLDRLVVSHADADHAGGAASLARTIRIDSLRASLADDDPLWHGGDASPDRDAGSSGSDFADARRCRAGESWEWDGIRFAMLWPDASTVAQGKARNAASCVLHVSNGRVAALLPGDIEAAQERTLVEHNAAALRADLLMAPHHGSRTSSSERFLDAVAPRDVVFQAGYRNRFGHPHAVVAARYVARGTRVHRSDRDGAVRASSRRDRFEFERCRESRRRYWMGQ